MHSTRLLDYAYCSRLEHESEAHYLPAQKVARVERYGGAGIGVNGGGVRCGLFDGMTVKGVGRSGLAGQQAPFWHSYGGASLREGIREAIWGEVFNVALPYGAVRVEGLLGTNTQVPLRYANSLGKTSCPRALILREPFLRPAHYLRASLFQPTADFIATHASDAIRTQEAIRRIEAGLRHALPNADNPGFEALLHSAFCRYAEQAATARAKRLLHGSISPSNIALDGRFLDFGMSSSVSDHGRIIIARDCPDAWLQHGPLLKAIPDLLYFLGKYDSLKYKSPPLRLADTLCREFLARYERRFATEIVKLTGFPESSLARLAHDQIAAAFACFSGLLKSGNQEPFKLLCPCPEYVPCMPQKMGNYHLATCFTLAADANSPAATGRVLADQIPDPVTRDHFVRAYWALRTAVHANYTGRNSMFHMFIRLNVRRVNARLEPLYAYRLNGDIDRLLDNDGDVAKFIDDRVAAIAHLVQDFPDNEVRLKTPEGYVVTANPDCGVLLSEASIREKDFSPLLAAVLPV